jgi:hypothetical protein
MGVDTKSLLQGSAMSYADTRQLSLGYGHDANNCLSYKTLIYTNMELYMTIGLRYPYIKELIKNGII